MTSRGRHALIVATDTYTDEGLSRLQAPRYDAVELAEVLGDPTIGAFTVKVLANPHSYDLRRKIEDFFADRSFQDTLVLHFACHGLKDPGGKLFLSATDTQRNRLASTAVPAEYVSALMMSSRAQRVALLLDCCYAGAFERGMFSRADAEAHVQDNFTDLRGTGGERGRAILTASSAVEYAFEGDRIVTGQHAAQVPASGGRPRPSLFTGARVEGLRTGAADLNGDGEIGLKELAEYVGERVRQVTPRQNPQLWIFGGQGDLPIGRAPRRAVRSGPLPAHLAAAVASPERERRLWAVTDLVAILQGTDVPVARTACTALMNLSSDDSRRVAEGAHRALADAQPRIATGLVDLGRVVVGVPGPQVTVPVGGPPVVRATLEAIADPWLRVRYVAEGVALSVDAPRPGRYAGTATLRTVTGSVTLQVTAEAVAPGDRRQQHAGPRHVWQGSASGGWNPASGGMGQPGPGPMTLASVVAPPASRAAVRSLTPLAPPLFAGAFLMALALVMPIFDYGYYPESTQRAFSEYAWPIGIDCTVSLVVLVAVAMLARAGRRAVRHRALRLPYYVLTLAGALYASGQGLIINDSSDYGLRTGYVVWAAGLVLQLWGASALWWVRNKRRKQSAT